MSQPIVQTLSPPHGLLQELTFIIKQDIAHINKQIAALQAHRKQQNAQGANKTIEGKQIDEHHNNIVMMLQGKLANTSMTFKDVLEVRTQVSTIEASHDLLIVLRTEHERVKGPNRAVHVLNSRCCKYCTFKCAFPFH